MRAISLWQPWATLIAIGAKTIETRSWQPHYVGPLAIHAAQRMNPTLRELCRTDPFRTVLAAAGFDDANALPLGRIVATCRLDDCLQSVRGGLARPGTRIPIKLVVGNEAAFGDYALGRFGWILEDIKPLLVPVPCKGRQSFFTWDPIAASKTAAVPAGLFDPRAREEAAR